MYAPKGTAILWRMRTWIGLAIVFAGCTNLAFARESQVLDLDGTDSYVQLPPGILDQMEEATVEAWVKFRTLPNREWARFFSYGGYLTDAGIQVHLGGRLYYFI